MQWLSDLPFADNRMVQIGFLAVCGLAALVVLAILYRFVFANRLRVPGGRTRQPRLGLVDAFSLDGQRQLVLVRRDNVEHLIMIGGPNDVLVEAQINRALAAARENTVAGGVQSKPPPPRRTEPVASAPPAPVAVPAAAPPAGKAPVAPPQPAAPPAAIVRGEVRPIRPQNVAPSPAPEASRPPAPIAPEPVAQPAPAATPKVSQPAARQIPLQPQPQPRPLPARPAMPSPITPIAAAGGRAAVSPLPGRPVPATLPAPAAPASIPEAPSALQPSPDERPSAFPKELGRAGSAAVPLAGSVKVAGTPVAPAAAVMTVKAEPRIADPKPLGGNTPPMDRRPVSPGADPSIIEKPAPAKAEDPFGGLESLEAEMSRLLGREK